MKRVVCLVAAIVPLASFASTLPARCGIEGTENSSPAGVATDTKPTVTNADTTVSAIPITDQNGRYQAPLLISGNDPVTTAAFAGTARPVLRVVRKERNQ